jgi:hypothetical protein
MPSMPAAGVRFGPPFHFLIDPGIVVARAHG